MEGSLAMSADSDGVSGSEREEYDNSSSSDGLLPRRKKAKIFEGQSQACPWSRLLN